MSEEADGEAGWPGQDEDVVAEAYGQGLADGRRRWRWVALLALAVLAGVAVAAVLVWRQEP